MVRLWVVLVCGMIGCNSCEDSGAPGGARFDFTSEGSGPANAAPLNPLRNGMYRDGVIVDGTIDLASGRARRMFLPGGEVTYVIDAEVGLFVAGGSLDGVLAHPILLVPATVRKGMAWTVEADTTSYSFVVSERQERTDTWGDVVTWTIVQTDAAGDGRERVYNEGIGNALPGAFDAIPLDTPDPEPSQAPIVTLEALPWVGEVVDLPSAYSQQSISMVHAPGQDAMLMYDYDADQGVTAVCLGVNAAAVTFRTAVTTDLPYLRAGPDVCPVWRVGPGHPPWYVSFHASLTYVEDNGTITWAGRHRGTYGAITDPTLDGKHSTPRALLPPHDGVHVDFLFEHGSVGYEHVALGGQNFLYGTQTEPDLAIPDPWFAINAYRSFISPIATDEGDRHMMLVRTNDEMLWLTRASVSGITTPVPVGRLGGVLSVQTTELGTEILRVTSDGQVDRLHVAGEQLLLEPLARVTLPENMILDGAFLVRDPTGDRLIATLLHLDGLGSSTKVFRSAQVVNASAIRQPIAPHHVFFTSAGAYGDVVVCLPGADGVELEGWTVGERPAGLTLEVTPGSRCVLAVRGPGQQIDSNLAFHSLRGHFPGMSFVAHAHDMTLGGSASRLADDIPFRLAPLTGGGAGNHIRRYGRGLVATAPNTSGPRNTTPPIYGPPVPSFGLLADARGDGLWGIRKRFNPAGTDVVRWGATEYHRAYADNDVRLQCASQKGGVIGVRPLASAWFHLTSNDVEVALPPHPYPLQGDYCTQLADGTLCGDGFNQGMNRWEYFCMDSTGGSLRVAAASSIAGRCIFGSVPLGNTLLIPGAAQLEQLDLTTLASSVYMDGRVWMGQATDGSVYGAVVATDGALMLYALETGGPRPLVNPGDYRVPPSIQYQLVVDDDVFMVIAPVSAVEQYALRIPR